MASRRARLKKLPMTVLADFEAWGSLGVALRTAILSDTADDATDRTNDFNNLAPPGVASSAANRN